MGRNHRSFPYSNVSIALLVLDLCLVPGARAGPQGGVVIDFGEGQDGVPRGWKLSAKEGRADLAVVMDGNRPALRLRSDSSSFALQREVEIDIKQTPYLGAEAPACNLQPPDIAPISSYNSRLPGEP